MSEELPEWYTVIKSCLREFECFDMKVFASSGGHEAYTMLEMKLQQHKTLLKLADIRERNAAEQPRAADVCPADNGKHSWYPLKDNYLIYECRKCGARG